MKIDLLEAYKDRLAISEGVYAKEHANDTLSRNQKIVIARLLKNTNDYLNEAMSHSVGTQRADLGNFKKFTLDLTTVAVPNLIANDLVIVHPMSSITGYIQYMQFTAGTNKGNEIGVLQGDVFNDPFHLGKMTDARMHYTGSTIIERCLHFGKTEWPCSGVFAIDDNTHEKVFVKGKVLPKDKTKVSECIAVADIPVGLDFTYIYDNVSIPQEDIPTLNARMQSIALEAKARRIAIYYSQMAAFQAKTEMGVDLGEVLATQACAELSYEIDTEVVQLLDENAAYSAELDFNKTLPVGVSKRDHYAGFSEIVEKASQIIYDKTQKHNANYMVCASNIKPVLALVEGFKAATTGKINGPYMAGTLNGIKVFVSPKLVPGRFFLGFNGGDLITSAAVFAPYMAIVPTSLLTFADGANSQGFSTLYDLKLLNKDLLVAGRVVESHQVVYTKAEPEMAE